MLFDFQRFIILQMMTQIWYTSKSLNDINRKVNYDLRHIVEWLRANKISLITGKTELVLFRPWNEKITKNMTFRISGQEIKILCKTKYLGITFDEHLTFKYHLKNDWFPPNVWLPDMGTKTKSLCWDNWANKK